MAAGGREESPMREKRCLVCDATEGVETLQLTSSSGLDAAPELCTDHMSVAILRMGFVLGELLVKRSAPYSAARWAERFEERERGELGPITGDELAAFLHMVQLDVIASATEIVRRATPDKVTRSAVTNLLRSTLLGVEKKIRDLGKDE